MPKREQREIPGPGGGRRVPARLVLASHGDTPLGWVVVDAISAELAGRRGRTWPSGRHSRLAAAGRRTPPPVPQPPPWPESQLTNPLDVVKIRQQLDGELKGRGSARKYPNFAAGLVSIVRTEGELQPPPSTTAVVRTCASTPTRAWSRQGEAGCAPGAWWHRPSATLPTTLPDPLALHLERPASAQALEDCTRASFPRFCGSCRTRAFAWACTSRSRTCSVQLIAPPRLCPSRLRPVPCPAP